MNAKLKHIIFFLAVVSLALTACGGGAAKPFSGLDVSLLPVGLPALNETEEVLGVNESGVRTYKRLNRAVETERSVIINQNPANQQ